MKRVLSLALMTGCLTGAAHAAEVCVTADEAAAFHMRHLQSKFVVAALSCNQSEAYNSFVARFQPELTEHGGRLIDYYKRAGGTSELNRTVTILANTAAQLRAADPEGFCAGTWQLFWELDQTPGDLRTAALKNVMADSAVPSVCAPAPSLVTAETKTETLTPVPAPAVVPTGANVVPVSAVLKAK